MGTVAKSFIIAAGLAFCAMAFANEPVIVDHATSPGLLPDNTEGTPEPDGIADPHGDIARYQKAIKSIEDTEGVYDIGLLPQLTGLGRALNAQGEHELAAQALVRAVHLSRINKGLHHPDQIPLLMDLVASYNGSEQWEKSANALSYVDALQRRTYGDRDPRLLPTIQAIIEWYIRASERELSAENVVGLMKAHGLNNLAIHILEKTANENESQLIHFLFTQAVIAYRLELFRSRENSYVGPGLKKEESTGYHLVKNLEQISATISPYHAGKRALSRRLEIIMANAEEGDETRLQAMMLLGDWHFLFNRRNTATQVYQQAHQLYSSHETAGQLLLQMTDQPALLSFDLASETRETGNPQGFVEAQFDVNTAGKARNVRIIDASHPDMERETRTLLRTIRYARFRPKLIAGEPVAFEGSTYRHSYELPAESPN